MLKETLIIISALAVAGVGNVYGGTGWEMTMRVSAGNAEARLAFGANPAARDGIDNAFDIPALFLEDAALKASLAINGGRFWRDMRAICSSPPCTRIWEVEIESSSLKGPVQITWNPLLFSGIDICLVDTHTGERIDMSRRANYSYADTKRFLRIEVQE